MPACLRSLVQRQRWNARRTCFRAGVQSALIQINRFRQPLRKAEDSCHLDVGNSILWVLFDHRPKVDGCTLDVLVAILRACQQASPQNFQAQHAELAQVESAVTLMGDGLPSGWRQRCAAQVKVNRLRQQLLGLLHVQQNLVGRAEGASAQQAHGVGLLPRPGEDDVGNSWVDACQGRQQDVLCVTKGFDATPHALLAFSCRWHQHAIWPRAAEAQASPGFHLHTRVAAQLLQVCKQSFGATVDAGATHADVDAGALSKRTLGSPRP
mmetsp:Transcript_48234/g.134625  ORF Transcript_48234/g.134625 Transcript_48234/m.134625 type:complete len:267 (-) Transcript_48234:281-1081(-)